MRRLVGLLALVLAGPVLAEVTASSEQGFVIEHKLAISATPAQAWRVLAQPQRWWPSAHTWSGQRRHLSLDLQAGGCFCERWKGGGAEHGRVIMLRTNELLRLNAPLGPFQDMAVSAVLSVALSTVDGATQALVTFRVNGTPAQDLKKLAPVVDRVLGQQFGNFAALASGKAPSD